MISLQMSLGLMWTALLLTTFLNITKALGENGTVLTPALRPNCTDLPSNDPGKPVDCTEIAKAITDCTTPDNSNNLSTGELLAIGLAAGILIAAILILVAVALACYLKIHRSRDKEDDVDSDVPVYLEPVKFETTDSKGAYNRSTLMMRSSVTRDAFIGTSDLPPRTGTLLKRMGTKNFMKMSPKQRIQALEFPHGNICILKDFAETNFGGTYLGEASGLIENELSTTVYIKSLREKTSSRLRQQFVAEMTWASGFSHPNVLTLLGVCNKEIPRYLIYEYMDFGSLKDFLQSIDSAWFALEQVLSDAASTTASSNAPMMGIDDLTNISYQLADGMEYLASKDFVHRDLAARNCQIGHGIRVKIANFGFTYDLHSEDYCHLSSVRSTMPLPLRWLAPETIQNGKFSPYTDVWSFGVLLWEVFSFGARPYFDLSNAQVVLQVMRHGLLPCPEKCPEGIYQVMVRCWSKVPSERPLFRVVREELNAALDGFELMDVRKFGRKASNPRVL